MCLSAVERLPSTIGKLNFSYFIYIMHQFHLSTYVHTFNKCQKKKLFFIISMHETSCNYSMLMLHIKIGCKCIESDVSDITLRCIELDSYTRPHSNESINMRESFEPCVYKSIAKYTLVILIQKHINVI